MFIQKPQKDYALIDAGEGLKLERYGEYSIIRPDPQALWPKNSSWPDADAMFARKGQSQAQTQSHSHPQTQLSHSHTPAQADEEGEIGNWVKTRPIPEKWPIKFDMGADLPAVNIYARLTPFKHTGIFPEQAVNWKWSMELIAKALGDEKNPGKTPSRTFNKENPPKILNLFGYSGGATIACLLAGAHVTHVDSSKGAITWANENAELAGVKDKPVRWILEDAVSFIKKEVRRGNKYDGIILDPPAFGRGAKGEVWKIERDFLPFLELIFELLSDKALFVILNGYAAGYSSIAYAQNLQRLVAKRGGVVEYGELCIEQDVKNSPTASPILLPCGIVARWKSV